MVTDKIHKIKDLDRIKEEEIIIMVKDLTISIIKIETEVMKIVGIKIK